LSDSSQRRVAPAGAQSGETELRRYLESHDPLVLDRAIKQLEVAVEELPDADFAKVRYMLILAGALSMRFEEKNDRADFDTAISWNEQALATNSDDVTRVQAFYNIGALKVEEYKRSGSLSVLEGAIDSFVESLRASAHEHPLRKPLIMGLQGMLVELTLKTPNAISTGPYWEKAVYAVPFRSFDQRALTYAWHAAFTKRMDMEHPPQRVPSFIETNRARLSHHAVANESPELRAITDKTEVLDIESYAQLQKKIEELRTKFPDVLLVFRGQTEFHDGRLTPSMARKTVQDGDETHLLWIAAVGENLRYGEPDPATRVRSQVRAALGLPPQVDESIWEEMDPSGPVVQAILQHYGARTHFIDVSTSVEVALWFAHFKFEKRFEVFGLDELAARGAHWDADDPAPEYFIAWYNPAWESASSALGYLFVLAPRLPQAGETLIHGEYIDLAYCPSPRMQAQQAGLVYMDPQHKEQGSGIVAVLRFRLPINDSPSEVLDPSVTRLFPPPNEDTLYGRILWSTPFWPTVDRPKVQVRRLRIPEYHSAPASRPDLTSWGDWSPFRARDMYMRPGFVFSLLSKTPGEETCVVAGREFLLSNALPIVPSVPSMMIDVFVPEPNVRLGVLGHSEVFLEYDPLSSSLSPRMGAHHITAQIDRRHQLQGSWVPLPGIRGAWVVQVGDLYWCRVYAQKEDGTLIGTAGHAFGWDSQFGWVVKEGREIIVHLEMVGMHAERAAFYLVLGIADQVTAGTWRVNDTPGSPYRSLSMCVGFGPRSVSPPIERRFASTLNLHSEYALFHRPIPER
jgi:FRG domain